MSFSDSGPRPAHNYAPRGVEAMTWTSTRTKPPCLARLVLLWRLHEGAVVGAHKITLPSSQPSRKTPYWLYCLECHERRFGKATCLTGSVWSCKIVAKRCVCCPGAGTERRRDAKWRPGQKADKMPMRMGDTRPHSGPGGVLRRVVVQKGNGERQT